MGRLFSLSSKFVLLAGLFTVFSLCPLQARAIGVPGLRARNSRPVVVGYFPQWGVYYPQPYYVKALVTNHSAAHLDQINYAQGFVSDGRCSVADPNADLKKSLGR